MWPSHVMTSTMSTCCNLATTTAPDDDEEGSRWAMGGATGARDVSRAPGMSFFLSFSLLMNILSTDTVYGYHHPYNHLTHTPNTDNEHEKDSNDGLHHLGQLIYLHQYSQLWMGSRYVRYVYFAFSFLFYLSLLLFTGHSAGLNDMHTTNSHYSNTNRSNSWSSCNGGNSRSSGGLRCDVSRALGVCFFIYFIFHIINMFFK